jgi:HPt (histidine-containing phosphotransfer) domain-containing protein
MDGYLSKPIDVDELVATVERFGGEKLPSPRTARRPSSKAAPAVFDQRAALAHTGGDRRLLEEVIALFRSDSPSYVRRMNTALKQRDGEALRMAAHGLKGALATIGSTRGRELCAELEGMGKTRRFADAATKVVRLRDHLKVLDQAFRSAGLSQ